MYEFQYLDLIIILVFIAIYFHCENLEKPRIKCMHSNNSGQRNQVIQDSQQTT